MIHFNKDGIEKQKNGFWYTNDYNNFQIIYKFLAFEKNNVIIKSNNIYRYEKNLEICNFINLW